MLVVRTALPPLGVEMRVWEGGVSHPCEYRTLPVQPKCAAPCSLQSLGLKSEKTEKSFTHTEVSRANQVASYLFSCLKRQDGGRIGFGSWFEGQLIMPGKSTKAGASSGLLTSQ